MPYQVLYRTWRPNSWREVVGQTAVVRILQNALLEDKVSHAYLFSGPRGTGKTTIARLLAKAVNCKKRDGAEPCNECESCVAIQNGTSVDVVEVDAASNRGIDEVRSITESTRYLPALGAYKVYIIDEVHMLTQEAFNALLKTLEEPPSHVIFILATTAPHRIPVTIASRCQRMDFRKLPVPDIRQRLTQIAIAEGVELEEEAAEALARAGDGSLRDAISLLDLCTAYGRGRVTAQVVQDVLGTSPLDFVEGMMKVLAAGDVRATLRLLREATDAGREFVQLTQELAGFARDLIFLKSGGKPEDVSRPAEEARRMAEFARTLDAGFLFSVLDATARAVSDMRGATDPRLVLEVVLLGLAQHSSARGSSSVPNAATQAPHVQNDATTLAGEDTAKRPIPEPVSPLSSSGEILGRVQAVWDDLLTSLQRRRLVKARAYLLPGKPEAIRDGNVLVVRFPPAYRTHSEQVMVPATRRSIEVEIARLTGLDLRIEAVTDESASGGNGQDTSIGPAEKGKDDDPLVSKAAELLEAAARRKSTPVE